MSTRARRAGVAGVSTAPPYRPPWYPNQDPNHNPWLMAEPVSGLTHYQVWVASLAPGELVRLIAEHRAVAGGS